MTGAAAKLFFVAMLAVLQAQLGVRIEKNVGMEGAYLFRYSGPELRARPFEEKSPIILRIADIAQDGETAIYDLRFIGSKPGQYNLRDYLERIDGEPFDGVPDLVVSVVSVLPEDDPGAMEEIEKPTMFGLGGYRYLMWSVVIAWCIPAVFYGIRRLRRRRPKEVREEVKELTLADQLRPLVEAALRGELSIEERARLELLLITHWREKLDFFDRSHVESLRRMREHPEAGRLLRQLEQWLHQRPGTSEVDVTAVLDPYRGAAAVALGEAPSAGDETPSAGGPP